MTTSTRRTAPLSAAPPVTTTGPSAAPLQDLPVVVAAPASVDHTERDQRFADGIRTLRVGGATLRLEERLLMVIGGVLAPLGVIMVLLGWWGAARTPYVFEQVPYLISGGLLGIGLVFLGAFFYFAHWMTQLVKEHRAQSVAVLEALQRLQDQLAASDAGHPRTAAAAALSPQRRNGSAPAVPGATLLVATERGTMAHRPDCPVVAGKGGLRPVSPQESLAACKLCHPYAES